MTAEAHPRPLLLDRPKGSVSPDAELRAGHCWLADRRGGGRAGPRGDHEHRAGVGDRGGKLGPGLKVVVSFVCKDESTLLSGEPIATAAVAAAWASGVSVNCTAMAHLDGLLDVLAQQCFVPIGA